MAALRTSKYLALRSLSSSGQIRQPTSLRQFTAASTQCQQCRTYQSKAPRSIRTFHQSRPLKAPGDESTIDFAHLPETMEPEAPEIFRVPILPDNYSATTNAAAEVQDEVMKPEISTMSADAVFLPMADLSDGHSLNIDFHAMADRVSANLRQLKVAPEEQASIMKQIWADLVDDMLGLKKKGGGEAR